MFKLETVRELEITVELYRGLLEYGVGIEGPERAREDEPLFEIYPFEDELFILLSGLEAESPL